MRNRRDLWNKGIWNREVAGCVECRDENSGSCPVYEPCKVRGTEHSRVEFTIAVVIAGNEFIGRESPIFVTNIVEMRFFGGMSNAEIAEALEISERTVGREWQSAKLWLYRELSRK